MHRHRLVSTSQIQETPLNGEPEQIPYQSPIRVIPFIQPATALTQTEKKQRYSHAIGTMRSAFSGIPRIADELDQRRVTLALRPLIKSCTTLLINTKPETHGCEEGARFRIHPIQPYSLGISTSNEIKTLIFENPSVIRIYVTPADYHIQSHAKKSGFKMMDPEKLKIFGIKAYEINPINILNIIRKEVRHFLGKRIEIVANPKIFQLDFVSNNIGSRYMACTTEMRSYWNSVDTAFRKLGNVHSDIEMIPDSTRFKLSPVKPQNPQATTPQIVQLVSPQMTTDLRSVLDTVKSSPQANFEDFLIDARDISTVIYTHLNDTIDRFKSGTGQPYLLIKGLPIDPQLPRTPLTVIASEKTTYASEALLMGMNLSLGQPFSYKYEKEGQCVHNICPNPAHEQSLSNMGSRVTFGFHMEMAFHKIKPDYLILICLKEDHERQCLTTMVDMEAAIAETHPETLKILREPLFKIDVPASYQREDWEPDWQPMIHGNTIVMAEHCKIHFKTPAAESALNELRSTLDKIGSGVHLEPGDLLVLDNRRIMHGRSIFTPRYDGDDRWLQRSYSHRDLAAAQTEWPHSERVFE